MHEGKQIQSKKTDRFCRGRTYLPNIPPTNMIVLYSALSGGELDMDFMWDLHRKYGELLLQILEAITGYSGKIRIKDAFDRRIIVFNCMVKDI
eukprot:3822281-Lingulodinium_polyedra.AAC.1